MKYVIELGFKDTPNCSECRFCDSDGQIVNGLATLVCFALERRPLCPSKGMLNDCPLKIERELYRKTSQFTNYIMGETTIDEWEDKAEAYSKMIGLTLDKLVEAAKTVDGYSVIKDALVAATIHTSYTAEYMKDTDNKIDEAIRWISEMRAESQTAMETADSAPNEMSEHVRRFYLSSTVLSALHEYSPWQPPCAPPPENELLIIIYDFNYLTMAPAVFEKGRWFFEGKDLLSDEIVAWRRAPKYF